MFIDFLFTSDWVTMKYDGQRKSRQSDFNYHGMFFFQRITNSCVMHKENYNVGKFEFEIFRDFSYVVSTIISRTIEIR